MILKIINIFILIIVLLTSCNRQEKQKDDFNKNKLTNKTNSEQESIFESLDSKLILTKLFDNPELDSTGAALWTPNFADRMNLPISFDGKCHTNIDTILYFRDNKENESAAVIFTHYYYVKEYLDSTKICIGGSHFTGVPLGIALFTKQKNNKWEIYYFEKHFSELGYFGTYRTGREDEGKICLRKIGDKWTCLSLRQGIGGSSGYSWGYESLYSIEKFQFNNQQNDDEVTEWYACNLLNNLLTYNYYNSHTSPDEKEHTEKKVELKTIEKKNDYYDIDLIIHKDGKRLIEKYSFSERYNKYIQNR